MNFYLIIFIFLNSHWLLYKIYVQHLNNMQFVMNNLLNPVI